MTRRAREAAFTLIELLVVIAIIGVLIGLTLSAVQAARQAALRTQCTSNLRQIGLGLHGYHDGQGSLPPGCSFRDGADPNPHMSWLTRLLPQIEQDALWRQALIAFEEEPFFEKGPHLPVLGTVIAVYSCPADTRTLQSWPIRGLAGEMRIAFTAYVGNGGTDRTHMDGLFFLDSRIRLTDIKDGTSNTLAVGERPPSGDHRLGWWYAGWGQAKDGSAEMLLGTREVNVSRPGCPPGPYGFAPGRVPEICDAFHFWSLHSGGANFLFADGSVHFLAYSADPRMPALGTRSGGEAVELPY
jgi:prepilin-type N-terminal cleavage/methylation domain-containing protein/prepilin-type processing-associated H-X9-DG protein